MNPGLKKLDRVCLSVVLMVSIILCVLLVNSWARQKKSIHREKELLSHKLEDLKKVETSLIYVKDALLAERKECETLNERIRESTGIGGFLKELDQLLKAGDIGLISVKPMPGLKENAFIKIPIQVLLTGPFIKIYHLLYDLETMKRLVVVKKMIINKSQRGKDCLAELLLTLYYPIDRVV